MHMMPPAGFQCAHVSVDPNASASITAALGAPVYGSSVRTIDSSGSPVYETLR